MYKLSFKSFWIVKDWVWDYGHQNCTDFIKIILWNIITIYKYLFSSHSSSLVSHDLSEIIVICWFGAQETFLIIVNVENSCAA